MQKINAKIVKKLGAKINPKINAIYKLKSNKSQSSMLNTAIKQ